MSADADLMHARISVPTYWSLPGPSGFLASLVHAFESSRTLLVRIESPEFTGVRHTIGDALRKACHEPERIEFLDVHEGSHLDSDIGHHFERAKLSAAELAAWSAPPRTTVVLTPHSTRARESARTYFEEFATELVGSSVDCTRMVLLWNDKEDPLAPAALATVHFKGDLTEDEMHAYVTLRMVGRRGPGTTSLARHLITEFAGGDPLLAEELIAVSHDALLELPVTLAELPARREGHHRLGDAVSDWLAVRAQSTAAVDALKRLERRYWRACVRTLLPWIEERRPQVIEALRPSLEDYLYPTKGVWKKRLPYREDEFIDVSIDELEFNDIVAMSRRQSDDPFKALDERAERAITCCFKIKRVRDALAHLRRPNAADIREMVLLTDELLQQIAGASPM